MPICTMCGKKKPTLASGWVQCPGCNSWYCPDCFKKLKVKPGLKNKKICIRCRRTF